ncbi:hypothetical protein BU16DRAFT_560137 [Lophium mytilinum]|uniref:Uncharacterized protein n=1 Tax=Lophium mytilinum TaxID=390894 RepID=A0A6A6QXM1_9PEZI|nr:hypothetical protein BU16DRAFT_560137 [Lophium mytilinum]
MASSGLFLLSQPLPPNTLSLGQLLPNPLSPSSGPFFSASTLGAQDLRKPHIQARYKDLVAFDDEGRLAASLSGRKVDPSRKDLVLLLADEMEYRSLQPNSAFDNICQDPAALSWMRSMAAQNQTLYFVVGLQELKNATFKSAVIQEGPLGVSVTEGPTAPKTSLPLHVRRDSSMDITDSSSTGVYGFEVRKVQCRLGRTDEPHLLEDLDLSWNYHRTGDGDLQLSIGMSKALQAEELRLLAAAMEDASDASYNSSDSE